MTETFQTMVSFFTKGGLFMWPLLVCSIVDRDDDRSAAS